MGKRPFGIVWIFFILSSLCGASADDLARQLQRLGYENVAVQRAERTVSVWCETRRVRYPVVWMLEALALAAESAPPDARVRLIAQRMAMPVVALEARADDVHRWIRGRMPTAEFRRRLTVRFAADTHAPTRENPSVRRVDLIIGPGRMLSEFGVPGPWLRMQADVSAELATVLWPGLVAYGRVFVPVYNRGGPVGGDARYGEVRPGSVLLSYFRAFGPYTFSTVTAGMFELGNRKYDSYGVYLDVQHVSADGRWALGWSFGYLGFAAYVIDNDQTGRHRIWQLTWPPHNLPYQACLRYRFEGLDLELAMRWGRFLGGDHGWRMDIARRFGELGVTIYGIKSDGRFDGADRVDRQDVRLLGGLRVEVPLYPRRRAMPERFRVTTPPRFAWSYRYRVTDVGVDVATKHAVEDFIAQYWPTVIRNNLDRARTLLLSASFREERIRHGVKVLDVAEN